MAHILASTRSAFFKKYDFSLDPCASLYNEFHRLAKYRKWKQGSKKGLFEKAWRDCFGPDVPVGCNIDKGKYHAQEAEEDLLSVLHKFQNLDLEGRAAKRVHVEFTSFYGSDVNALEIWQTLCEDCGVNPVPASISKCKKVLKGVNINIFHFLEAKKAGILPHRFRTRNELAEFMERHPKKKYPLGLAKQNKLLSVLLIECW